MSYLAFLIFGAAPIALLLKTELAALTVYLDGLHAGAK
jgi:hypothetical protein